MDKMTVAFYGAALTGVLMITTFLYSVILAPAWNWVGTLPGAIKSATSGMFMPSAQPAKYPVSNSPANNYQQSQTSLPGRTPKPANCGQVIKQIKAGKAVSLPPECEQTYQAIKEQDQAKLEQQKQKDELKQKEFDRQKEERENAQKLQLERQRDLDRQRDEARQREQAERASRDAAFAEQQRAQAEERRRQAEREDASRREAQRAADQRERQRQQGLQKRNDSIIKLGNDIRNKIFRKNR